MAGLEFPNDRPLLNVSQAAPTAPPPPALREAMSKAVLEDPGAHLYGPDLGLPALRAATAAHTAKLYGGTISTDQVAITSGCNQAFAAAIMAITAQNDEVILPTPWYFNHKMWLDMLDARAVPLPTGADLRPDPSDAAKLITDKTRAIVLVSPNNPAGVEYPPDLLHAFSDLCQAKGIYLIIDETYRDFSNGTEAPHALFQKPDWPEHFIHLYSFSKAYRLTGHRIGAMIAAAPVLAEVEKFIDTVTICPNQIGQRAALFGLQNLSDWVAGERDKIHKLKHAIQAGFDDLKPLGWKLKGLGAYFAYVEHPFDAPADEITDRLLTEASLLCLPATMFMPSDDPTGARHIRIAFANLNPGDVGKLFDRLKSIR